MEVLALTRRTELVGGWGKVPAITSVRPAQVNGHPALVVRLDGELDTVLALRIDDGLIGGIYAVRNPESCRTWSGPPP